MEKSLIIQKADEELREVRRLYVKVEQSLLKSKAIKESCAPGAVRYDKDRVQTSPTNHTEDKLIDAVDVHSEYVRLKGKYEKKRHEVLTRIMNLKNDKEAAVLIKYYINFCTWWEISHSMGMSEATVHRIRKKALENYMKNKSIDCKNMAVL